MSALATCRPVVFQDVCSHGDVDCEVVKNLAISLDVAKKVFNTRLFFDNVFICPEIDGRAQYLMYLDNRNCIRHGLKFGTYEFERGDDGQPAHFTELDIVAHEVGHALIMGQIDFENTLEADAINESFADNFAMATKERAIQLRKYQVYDNEDFWTLGDRAVGDIRVRGNTIHKQAIRSFRNPGFASRNDDQSLVYNYNARSGHTNCGILNHLFFRICTETNRSAQSVAKVWLRALKNMERSRAQQTFLNLASAIKRLFFLDPRVRRICDEVMQTAFPPPQETYTQHYSERELQQQLYPVCPEDSTYDLGEDLLERERREQHEMNWQARRINTGSALTTRMRQQQALERERRWMQPSWQCQLRLPVR